MAAIEIRRATPDEAPMLTRLAHAAKRHWRYPDELMLQWKDALTVTESFIAASPVFAAFEGSACVGFYAIAGDGAMRDLEHMWVAPEHLGRGIGTRLFEHALLTLRAEGAQAMSIASDPFAEGFYVKMGARRIGDWPSTPEGRTLPLLQYDL